MASLMREFVGDDDGDALLVGEGGHAGLVEQGGLPVHGLSKRLVLGCVILPHPGFFRFHATSDMSF